MAPFLLELFLQEMEKRKRFEEMAKQPKPQEYPDWMQNYMKPAPYAPPVPMPNQMEKQYPGGYGSVTPNMFKNYGYYYGRRK